MSTGTQTTNTVIHDQEQTLLKYQHTQEDNEKSSQTFLKEISSHDADPCLNPNMTRIMNQAVLSNLCRERGSSESLLSTDDNNISDVLHAQAHLDDDTPLNNLNIPCSSSRREAWTGRVVTSCIVVAIIAISAAIFVPSFEIKSSFNAQHDMKSDKRIRRQSDLNAKASERLAYNAGVEKQNILSLTDVNMSSMKRKIALLSKKVKLFETKANLKSECLCGEELSKFKITMNDILFQMQERLKSSEEKVSSAIDKIAIVAEQAKLQEKEMKSAILTIENIQQREKISEEEIASSKRKVQLLKEKADSHEITFQKELRLITNTIDDIRRENQQRSSSNMDKFHYIDKKVLELQEIKNKPENSNGDYDKMKHDVANNEQRIFNLERQSSFNEQQQRESSSSFQFSNVIVGIFIILVIWLFARIAYMGDKLKGMDNSMKDIQRQQVLAIGYRKQWQPNQDCTIL